MTVTNVLSTYVTAQVDKAVHGGKNSSGHVKGASSICETASAATDNCVMVFFKIPVDANIISMGFASDDSGTTGLVNVGLYPGNLDPAALVDTQAVDEDCIGTVIDVNTAAVARTEIRYETLNIDTCGKKAWELAGLSARPAYGDFFVCATTAAAFTATGVTVAIDATWI